MSEFVQELAKDIAEKNKPNKEILRAHSIMPGLRDDQGAGIIVGATNKGCVTGYDKVYQSVIPGDTDEKTVEKPWQVAPTNIFYEFHGREPESEQELERFIPKIRSILPYLKEDLEGNLRYSGIDINELVTAHKGGFGFEEVSYLLLTGVLPRKDQLDSFKEDLRSRRELPKDFRIALLHHHSSRNIMNSLQTAVDNLYDYDPLGKPDSVEIEDVTRHSLELIAKFPSLVAYGYHGMKFKYNGSGLHIVLPSKDTEHAEDFLRMFKGEGNFTQEDAKFLDLFLLLHMEHGGGNNSTFTVRVASSSNSDTYSSISAGLAALKGFLHGGANERAVKMMQYIQDDVHDWKDKDEVHNYLCRWLRKEVGDHSGIIQGFGHAVYTKSDPRALILKEEARKFSELKGRSDEFNLMCLVEDTVQQALKDVKNDTKTRAPNVDFYSGFALDCIGIPLEVYTPLFAMARVAGWCSHRLEQLVQNRIIRPAYFESATVQPYVSLEKRV